MVGVEIAIMESSELCVVGFEYCNAKAVELVVVSNVMVPKPDVFVRGCGNNKTVFTVEDRTSACGLHKRRVLLSHDGDPILSFKDQVMTLHQRWRVYKASGVDKKDLIFTAKQSSIMGPNKELIVFLASNKEEKICDFRVVASSDMFYFYLGDSIVIAEMSGFTVKVYPNVDQALIVSLIVILNAMNHSQRKEGDEAKLKLNVTILSIGMLTG